MIFGLVLDSAFEEEEREDIGFQIPHHCEHCLRPIQGRQCMIGNHYFCRGCFKFRYVLEVALAQEEKKIELKKLKNLQPN